MAKYCGKCKHFTYVIGDLDARDYPDGGHYGFCTCPLPKSVDDLGNMEMMFDDRYDCDCYKKRKETNNGTDKS